MANILVPGKPLPDSALADLSVWPDQIKNPQSLPVNEQSAARAFNTAHPFNRGWHFVNLPLDAGGYPDVTALNPHDPLGKFVRQDHETADICAEDQ